jgi:hypothetical protein
VLGQSGDLAADSDAPPAPVFGVGLSPTTGGVLDLGAIGFTSLVNTRGIVAGTYKFHLYDEVNGAGAIAVPAAVAAADTTIAFGQTFTTGALVQIDQEILEITATHTDGSSTVTRGVHGSLAVDHVLPVTAYPLSEKVLVVPFIRNFFGSPASGDWEFNVSLPNVRVSSIELYMTNGLGDGPATTNLYTGTIDSGLRTLAGGQFSFQINGYLAIQTGAAPIVIVDADRSVRDMYAVVRTPPAGAAIGLQINRNGAPYAALQIGIGAIISGVAGGFGLPALRASDQLSLDITGVGTTIPGSDLTLILRL